ncbi:MAG: hypothetical protein HY204_02295 [Nitrospirae bacterium]|nr:hypothetical protein [Nitrospirota bacterium]
MEGLSPVYLPHRRAFFASHIVQPSRREAGLCHHDPNGSGGAQHSQALHAWFAHVPGLRVVMPATPQDARDLLIAGVLSDDPVFVH